MPPKTRQDWRGAVIGMVMGDGSLYRNQLRNGQPTGDYKIDIGHGDKQFGYLLHKKGIVNQIFDYDIPITEKIVQNKYLLCRFVSRTHPRLSTIGKEIYINGKKRITSWVLDNITDEGMAYWYMDDGCLYKRKNRPNNFTTILAVNGFLEEDVDRMLIWLNEKYQSQFKKNKHVTSGYDIRGGITKTFNFLDAMKPYRVPCLDYKFEYNMPYRTGYYSTLRQQTVDDDIART